MCLGFVGTQSIGTKQEHSLHQQTISGEHVLTAPGEQLLSMTSSDRGQNYGVLQHLQVLAHLLPKVTEDVWFANQAVAFGTRLENFLREGGKYWAKGENVLRLLTELRRDV